MRFLLILVLWLLPLCSSQAEVKILQKHKVANQGTGYCVWCCFEMMGNHFDMKELQGMVDWYVKQGRGGAATPPQVDRQLQTLGVKYEARYRNRAKDLGFIKKHTDAGRPVMVAVVGWVNTTGGSHAILITHVTAKEVHIVDPNDIEYNYTWDIATFTSQWEAWAVVVIPPTR